MAKKKKRNSNFWLFVGLAGALLAAPNATVIRSVIVEQDMFLFNVERFAVVALACLPFLLTSFHKLNRKNVRYALISAVWMAVAVTTNVLAIKFGTASYVSIITLITPIIMVILSAKLIGDKITPRAIAGISLAALGSIVTILLPIAIQQGSHFTFYPLATLFALANSIAFPLTTIYYRKANEGGVPFAANVSMAAILIVITNFLLYHVDPHRLPVNFAQINWWAVAYSGFAVAFVARTLNLLCYEHIGAAAVGVLSYVGSFFAILIPVFVLGEHLSMTMIIGGILMFAGVWVIEHHKYKHHKHFHLHINH